MSKDLLKKIADAITTDTTNLTESSGYEDDKNTLSIVRMIIIRSGTYNTIIRRPYTLETTPENIDALGAVLEETRLKPQSTNLSTMSDMIKPDPLQLEIVDVPYGWDTPRYRFIIEVDATISKMPRKYIYQGYSDYADESISGKIDPNITWYINSVTAIAPSNPYGSVSDKSVVIGNANILQSHIDRINSNIDDTVQYSLRPKDIFTGENVYMFVPNMLGGDDTNVVNLSAIVKNTGLPSDRSNNIPNRYMSEIVRSYAMSREMTTIGSDIIDTFNAAAGMTGEYQMQNDPFLRLLGDIDTRRTGTRKLVAATFHIDDLLNYDPSLNQRIQYIQRQAPVRQQVDIPAEYDVHQTGATENWDKTSLETQIATILIDTIPAIMAESLLSRIYFTVVPGIDGRPVFTPYSGNSLFNIPLDEMMRRFENRLLIEIYPYLTKGGLFTVSLTVNASLYGDIWVSIQLDNQPEVTYNAPSFMDSTYAPVLTKDEQTYQNLVFGFNEVFGLVDNMDV